MAHQTESQLFWPTFCATIPKFSVLVVEDVLKFQIPTDKIEEFLQSIEEVRRLLQGLKEEVEFGHYHHQITSTVYNSVSIAGGITTLAGILLVPFTGGLSALLPAIGLTTTIGGGVGSVVNNLINASEIKYVS